MFAVPSGGTYFEDKYRVKLIQYIREISEREAFGVFKWMGDKMNIRSSEIRISFIYVSFVTFGSPILIYLVMAFILKNKRYFKPSLQRSTVWEI